MPPRRRNSRRSSIRRSRPSPPALDPARIGALPQALDLALAPTLAATLRRRPLPHDVLTLIRIAAGCGETLAAAAAATGREPDFILASAELYLRQVVCFPGADPHRVLAVPPHAPRDEMRRHLRELLLWLHPDRSRSEWNAVATRRVIAAWQAVGDAAAAQPPRRMRPVPAFRPSWIARPLTRARPIRAPRHRLWGLLRLALLVAGMVVPAFVPFGLTAGLTRLPDASHGVRAGGDVATLAGCGGPVS